MTKKQLDNLYKKFIDEEINENNTKTAVIEELEKLRKELHETAEMHSDRRYYLRDEWIDEYIDNHISELKGEKIWI